MKSLVLALVLATDGGSHPSGWISIRSGMLMTDRGVPMIVDGGVWGDDATLMQTALSQRVLKEQLLLAQQTQQDEITKWVGFGATGGSVVTLLVIALIYGLASLGK
jgi:hypothetical protein